MPVPKPHDPRGLQTRPEDIDKRVAEILGEDVAELEEEKDQLESAHAVLKEALQES